MMDLIYLIINMALNIIYFNKTNTLKFYFKFYLHLLDLYFASLSVEPCFLFTQDN